ncbi:MAG: hypothetical protein ABIG11_04860, partial [bacterium]
DLKTKDVDVPEWCGTVRVRALTGLEKDNYEDGCIEQNGKNRRINLINMRAKLVAVSVVNEKGERLFTEIEVKDLGRKSAIALDRVFQAAQELSGLGDEDVKKLAEGLKVARGGSSVIS